MEIYCVLLYQNRSVQSTQTGKKHTKLPEVIIIEKFIKQIFIFVIEFVLKK